MHQIVAEVSKVGIFNYQVNIKVVDIVTSEIISERPYCIEKDVPLVCQSRYRAMLVQEVVQKALNLSMAIYYKTNDIDQAVFEFDYVTVYSPIINYPASRIKYA